jgi:hypothetical protein
MAVLTIFILLTLFQAANSHSETSVGADDCYYKFTVQKVVDSKTLEVKYPPSVFKVTTKQLNEDDKQQEDAYVKRIKDKEFKIQVKPGITPEKGKTYLLVRCPDDSDYEIKKDIDEDDEN